jgi:signal transduction histidine kinase
MSALAIFNQQIAPMPAVASIVHDLRNPLSTIHGSAEMLIASGLSEPQVHRIARNVYGASVRMKELLDEFLTRFGSPAIRVQQADLRGLISGAVTKVKMLAESQSVRVYLRVPENTVIPVDRLLMQRVLVNLFLNALDVMPDGGTLRISVTPLRDVVLIKVRDTGPGIAPEIRERLFQPFATAGKPGGMGLGLALSRQAVLDHGGDVWADSPAQGASFTIRLPRRSPHVPISG